MARKPGKSKRALGPLFFPCALIKAGDISVIGVREDINLMLFYCSHCAKMIAAVDSESTNQIVDRLDEHIEKCPSATFTYEGTSNVARRRLGDLGSLFGERLAAKIRLLR
jgi:hypothetical protein